MKKPFMAGYKVYDTSNGFGNAKKWRKAFKSKFTQQEAQDFLDEDGLSAWDVMGLPATSTQDELKKRYRELLRKWHPDRNPDNVRECTIKTQKIIAAYTLLKKEK